MKENITTPMTDEEATDLHWLMLEFLEGLLFGDSSIPKGSSPSKLKDESSASPNIRGKKKKPKNS